MEDLRFRKLSAKEQLAVLREYPGLVPGLCARGLGAEDALALAHNATLLFHAAAGFSSPEEVLSRLSLGEIAAQCARYERGEFEDGEAAV